MTKILEGWKQIEDFLGYSESHLRRLWRHHPIKLAHWRGPGTRMRMTLEEARLFEMNFRKRESEEEGSTDSTFQSLLAPAC